LPVVSCQLTELKGHGFSRAGNVTNNSGGLSPGTKGGSDAALFVCAANASTPSEQTVKLALRPASNVCSSRLSSWAQARFLRRSRRTPFVAIILHRLRGWEWKERPAIAVLRLRSAASRPLFAQDDTVCEFCV